MLNKVASLMVFVYLVFLFNLAYVNNLKLFNVLDKKKIDKQQVQFIFSMYMIFTIAISVYIFAVYIYNKQNTFDKNILLILFTMIVIFNLGIIFNILRISSDTEYNFTNFDINLIKYSVSIFYLLVIFSFYLIFDIYSIFIEKDLIQRLNINNIYENNIKDEIKNLKEKFSEHLNNESIANNVNINLNDTNIIVKNDQNENQFIVE